MTVNERGFCIPQVQGSSLDKTTKLNMKKTGEGNGQKVEWTKLY